MALYRVGIKLKSPIVTLLKGDTIWGHVVCGIARHEGDEGVAKFLDATKLSTSYFAISSAFPRGCICLPIPEPQKRLERMPREKYAEIKKKKKIRYIKASTYLSAQVENIAEWRESSFKGQERMRASINRMTGTVQEDGSLFEISEMWADTSDGAFDLYVASSLDASHITQLCQWAFENGYGEDSSVGAGWIEVCEGAALVKTKEGNSASRYMALAPFVLQKGDEARNLRSDIFVRNGKAGCEMTLETGVPWKKPVVLFDEGAVFDRAEEIETIGHLLTGVHVDSRVCQAGFAPVIPI